jgi:hypothetical protein
MTYYYIESKTNPGWYFAQRYFNGGQRTFFWTQNKKQAFKTQSIDTYNWFRKMVNETHLKGLRSMQL